MKLLYSRKVPDSYHQSEVLVKINHRNFMGGDDFLGQTTLSLADFDVYEKPRTRYP